MQRNFNKIILRSFLITIFFRCILAEVIAPEVKIVQNKKNQTSFLSYFSDFFTSSKKPSNEFVAQEQGKQLLHGESQNIKKNNIEMNDAERKAIDAGLIIGPDGKKTYTSDGVTVVVDDNGKIISSTARWSRFEKPINEVTTKKESLFLLQKIQQENENENKKLQPSEERAIAFGEKRKDGIYDVYIYKSKGFIEPTKVWVDKDNKIIDSNDPQSQFRRSAIDLSRLARGKFDTNNAKDTSIVENKKADEQIFLEDLERARIDVAQQLLSTLKFSNKVQLSMTKSIKIFSSQPDDINLAKKRAEKFGENARTTVKTMSKQISFLQAGSSVKTQNKFCDNFIRETLKNNFGIDANSYEQLLSIKDQQALYEILKTSSEYAQLRELSTKNKSIDVITLDCMAKIDSKIMNYIAGDIATFTNSFDLLTGDFISEISSKDSNGNSVIATSRIDNVGKVLQRSLTIGTVEYRMDYKENKATIKSGKDTQEELSSYENSLAMSAWLLYKADRCFKMTSKMILMGIKQGALNLSGLIIPMLLSEVTVPVYCALAPIIMILPEVGFDENGSFVIAKKGQEVKTLTGMHLSGHSLQDVKPALLTTTSTLLKFLFGDNGAFAGGLFGDGKALLSTQSGRVFRQGTWISDFLNSMQGATEKQIEDVQEGYVDFMEPIFKGLHATAALFFPQTFGDQILSEKKLSQAIDSFKNRDVSGDIELLPIQKKNNNPIALTEL